MTVNKYYIQRPINDEYINLRVEMDWIGLGQDFAIAEFNEKAVDEVVGDPIDFEVNRFSHSEYNIGLDIGTAIFYNFYFYGGPPTTPTNILDWVSSYQTIGYIPEEIYYIRSAFNNSFFKIDFYDLPDEKAQSIYLTVIIPTQQGFTETANVVGLQDPQQIRIPSFKLDFLGDKEGFFLYWLKKRNFLDISTMYMTAKFYDAKIGKFRKMMNTPQSSLPVNSRYSFESAKYFYYKVELDYVTQTYQVYNMVNAPLPGPRVGYQSSPINWYEYVNPQ